MINWQEVPFVRLLIPFLLGLLSAAFGYFDFANTSILILLGVLFLFIFLWSSKKVLAFGFRNFSGLVLMLLLGILGQIIWRIQTPNYQNQHYIHSESDKTNYLFRINDHKLSRSGKYRQFKVTILGIEAQPGVLKRIKGESFCYLPADINLEVGDCVFAKGKLDTLSAPQHPGSFDFARYMALQGMIRQLKLQTDELYRLADDPFPNFRGNLRLVRSQLQKRLTSILPESSAGLVIALVLGQKNQLDAAVKTDYTEVGAMHVLAVSGMHVGIIAMGISYLLAFWTGGRAYIRICKGLISVSCIWIFALLTGGAPSVLRAATMFSLFILAKELYFSKNIWNILAATALLMLCAQSRALFTVGFQLSFFAVAAIVYFQPKLAALVPIKNQIGNYFWQLFTLGIAAQFGTAILSIHYFHQFPIYFWLSGLIIVPLATIALLLGVGVLTLAEIPYLGKYLAYLLEHLVGLMNASMAWISELPGSTIQNLQISAEVCFALSCLILWSALWLEFRSKKLAVLIFSTALLTGSIFANQQLSIGQQKQILVFHHKKDLAFCLIKGRKAINFCNKAKVPTTLDYAKSSFFQAQQIKQDSTVDLHYTSGLIQWDTNQILVVQNSIDWTQLKGKRKIDLAIIGPGFSRPETFSAENLDIKTYYLHPKLSQEARLWIKRQVPISTPIIDARLVPFGLHIDLNK
ncbi:MAG: ComEC/Rec2 family competence protein [Bacteroidota bacterium]